MMQNVIKPLDKYKNKIAGCQMKLIKYNKGNFQADRFKFKTEFTKLKSGLMKVLSTIVNN